MAWAPPQDIGILTPAEQKILRADGIVHKFTHDKWEAFNIWIEANDPNVPLTQQWLSQNDIEKDASFLCTPLLTKLAAGAQHNIKPDLGEAGRIS